VNAGIVRVVYGAAYPDHLAGAVLRDSGVESIRFP
jgi:deoxycytidylate deaminase